jgi:hypothetical protein
LAIALSIVSLVSQGVAAPAFADSPGVPSTSSSPADKTVYSRPAVARDLNPAGTSAPGALVAAAFLRDPIMSNPSPNGAGGSEPSIAINPSNPNEIVIAAGFGGWNGNARLFHSLDGGNTWNTRFTIPAPPLGAGTSGCPCDQTFDFDRSGTLYGTFLTSQVYSGGTTNPASAAAWTWTTTGPPTTAVTTNQAAQTSVDQPWLLVNRDPTTAAQDNVYVAYDDFTINPGVPMRVATSTGGLPLNFTRNVQTSGATAGPGNPGHRLANDRGSGLIYDLWVSGAGGNNFSYLLNRSSDGGATWTLNGSATGITVVTSPTNFGGKFGTVNALLGGVDHAAVDPVTGYVYVVHGAFDSGTTNNRLAIKRLQYNGTGTLNVASSAFVTGQVQAALPSVAVTDNETVGVLYTTFDGFSSVQDPSNPGNFFPIFSAHFASSTDLGVTFTDTILKTFLSPATSTNPSDSQRVLGDFQQLKAVGNVFYGVFSGNGAQFGTTSSQIDPIFFKVSAVGPQITVAGNLDFGTVAQGTTATRSVEVTNTGNETLVINGVSLAAGSDSSFSVQAGSGFPQVVQPDDSVSYTVRFSPPTGTAGGTRTGTLVIESNDQLRPTVSLPMTGTIGVPNATLSSSALDFGAVAVDDRTNPNSSDRTVTISNHASCAGCDLTLLTLPITGTNASDFTVVGAPALPKTIPANGSLTITVRFNPSGGCLRTATLTVNTDDPLTPTQTVSLSGTGLLPAVSATPNPLIFGPTVLDPACGGLCGQTGNVTFTNTGLAEWIIDIVTVAGNAAFSGPAATSPPTRVQPGSSFVEAVTFHPTGTTPSRAMTGSLTLTHNVAGAVPGIAISQQVQLCGEAVGRGIRVLAFDRAGNPLPSVTMLRLQSFGTVRKVNIVLKNLALTTINPPTSCQQIQFQYENQDLPSTDTGGSAKPGSQYSLSVYNGNQHADLTFTLRINEFKVIRVTIP